MWPALSCLVLVAALASACADDDEAQAAPTCAEAMQAADQAIEVDEQIRLLDAALLACGSHAAYVAELAQHPGLVGYSPERFVEVRCRTVTDPQLRRAPACRTANPPTTPPVTTAPDIVYAAATLDGRVIELRPSAAVPFTGDVPSVVQETVDIAVDQNCPGVLAQRDRWARRAAEQAGTDGGDIASAYAQHAIFVARWIGCEDADLPGDAPGTTSPAG